MIANEYGRRDGDLSATHHEYRRAQELKLPTIVFLKGSQDDSRSTDVRSLIDEAKQDGYRGRTATSSASRRPPRWPAR